MLFESVVFGVIKERRLGSSRFSHGRFAACRGAILLAVLQKRSVVRHLPRSRFFKPRTDRITLTASYRILSLRQESNGASLER